MAKYLEAEYAQWAKDAFDWEKAQRDARLVELPIDALSEDRIFAAQRELDHLRADEMARVFIPAVAWPITVVKLLDGEMAGQLIADDGQHRWYAGKHAGEATFTAMYYELGEEQAAAFFRLRNGSATVKATPMVIVQAAEVSGHPLTLHMGTILQRYGCFLNKNHVGEGAITAAKTCETIYRVDGGKLLDMTLSIITECWGAGEHALNEHMMTGVAQFWAHWGDQIDKRREQGMRKRFTSTRLAALLKEVDEMRQRNPGLRTNTAIEAALRDIYSHNLPSAQQLPYLSTSELRRLPSLAKLAAGTRTQETCGGEGANNGPDKTPTA